MSLSTSTTITIGHGMTESTLEWQGRPLHRVKNVSNRKKYEFAVIYLENEPGLVVPWPKPGQTPGQWLLYAAEMTKKNSGVVKSIYFCR